MAGGHLQLQELQGWHFMGVEGQESPGTQELLEGHSSQE